MNALFLYFVTIIHVLFILFVILTPFTNSNYLLFLHVIMIPFVMLHWVLNENTCALTLLEKNIREQLYGKTPDSYECFTARIIEPIYDFKQNYSQLSNIIYIVTVSLWLISVSKLYDKYKTGEIKSVWDLALI